MKKTAVVLAAHGSRHEPAVNEQIRLWARQIGERAKFDEVAIAFHQGFPSFCDVIDLLRAEEITVVPVMTSAGYYSEIVLPRELARNRRFKNVAIRRTSPVGMHRAIPCLIRDRVHQVVKTLGILVDDYTLGFVGHGTPRHPASRNSTIDLGTIMRELGFAEVVSVFLDDEPNVESLIELATKSTVVVVPFLIGAGPHATSDIPRRIGMPNATAGQFPLVGNVGTRRVCCDCPLGNYPEMIDLIVDSALAPVQFPRKKEVA
jgi:sirohydrochlorin ferrochelatase